MEYTKQMIKYPKQMMEYPKQMIKYPKQMIKYLKQMIEYPKQIKGYPKHMTKNEWKQNLSIFHYDFFNQNFEKRIFFTEQTFLKAIGFYPIEWFKRTNDFLVDAR